MSEDKYAHGFTKWEARFQQSTPDQSAVRPDPRPEVKIAARAYRERYGDGPAKAVDLGAGDGRHTVFLAAQGFDTLAVEAAPSGVDLIRQKLERESLSAELVVADLREYTLSDNIDLLISSYVIHLLPDPYEQIKTWQAKVRPGGGFSLATRGPFPFDPDHYWFPQDFELRDLMADAGWFVLHAHEEDNWRSQMNLVFRDRAVVAVKPE
jgi:trans-aconitate methyltransferase